MLGCMYNLGDSVLFFPENLGGIVGGYFMLGYIWKDPQLLF